jgi:PAS domain S-box-containing protein
MEGFHKLLERQLRKHAPEQILQPDLLELFKTISNSYHYYERDRQFLERAMEVSSKELLETNRKLAEELKNKSIAEQTILEKDQIIRSINENLREAVFRTSKNKVIYINQAFLELFGYDSEEEVLKEPPGKFYFSAKSHKQLLRKLIKHRSVKSEEILFKRKDGTSFWGLISTMVSYNNDGDNFFDGAIIDISTQKQNEENLKNTNSKLQKANSELDRFVYSASHDLRAPLKSMLGLLNLIEMEKGSDITLYLDRMRNSVVKLDNFITDIIDYSLNSRIDVSYEAIDLTDLIEDCFLHFKYLPFSDTIHKSVEMKSTVPFYGDRKRLQIIFNNLISNAINYRNPGQEQPFIKVEVVTEPDISCIVIHDNGMGIEEHHIDKIFNMFYRGTTNSNGSGLGLYIVKEALEKMHGNIHVASNKNLGTKFTIEVPNHYHKVMDERQLRDSA